jgi:hypothetical protein
MSAQAFWGWGALVAFIILGGITILAVLAQDKDKKKPASLTQLSAAQWGTFAAMSIATVLVAYLMSRKAVNSGDKTVAESFSFSLADFY